MATASDLADDSYKAALDAAIEAAIDNGAASIEEICVRCKGAGIDIVARRVPELGYTDEQIRHRVYRSSQRAALARNRAGSVLSHLPAPDPERAQWWFTLETVERLASVLASLSNRTELALLAMPSVAAYYATRYEANVTLFDCDPDVVKAASIPCELPEELRTKGSRPEVEGVVYDVKDEPIPRAAEFGVVALDSPWYDTDLYYFAARASSLVRDGGIIVTTLPGILTRPGLAGKRKSMLSEVFCGLEFVNEFPELVGYRVPQFEGQAHASLGGISGMPWRRADVVILLRRGEVSLPQLPPWTEPEIMTFSKNACELRLFLAPSRVDPELVPEIEEVPEYRSSVSRRGTHREKVALWSSNKNGFKVKNADTIKSALKIWAKARNLAEALKVANDQPRVIHILKELYSRLELPADTRDTRRTDAELVALNHKVLSVWATHPTPRQVLEQEDGYRLPHARDRDRVIWSDGLKRLANKTQAFSLDNSDYVRQRLAHSIEVMQLAGTIGTSFGLDRDLIEAGALAHDIGHTPFGHAGEYALDVTLNSIHRGFGGFNHYEHGVDVVRWLEDVYRSPVAGGLWGLNLTRAVSECIFKHTYCITGHRISQAELWNRSKHRESWPELMGDTPCHLEGQAVRIADKISYLVSDLEDGIRLGAIGIRGLRNCRLFNHAPMDYERLPGESELERYLSQRRVLLKFLVEDVINATAKRLAGIGDKTKLEHIKTYTADHSTTVKEEVAEVWTRLQSGILHKDSRVVSANFQASRMVSRLFVLCAIQPSLVERDFARSHRQLQKTSYIKWYRKNAPLKSKRGVCALIPDSLVQDLQLDATIGLKRRTDPPLAGERTDGWEVPVEDIVMAKDFVASLTDARTRRLYREIVGQGPDAVR